MSLTSIQTTTYTPSSASEKANKEKEYALIKEGKHGATIQGIEYKKRDWTMTDKKTAEQYLCDMITVKYQISEGEFEGRFIWSNPVWVFKDPHASDSTHVSNPKGNTRYSNLLEVVGYPFKETKDKDGEISYLLPLELDEEMLIDKPVLITVYHNKYVNKDGENKINAQEKYIDTWKNAPVKETTSSDEDDDDLPF